VYGNKHCADNVPYMAKEKVQLVFIKVIFNNLIIKKMC